MEMPVTAGLMKIEFTTKAAGHRENKKPFQILCG
jgi:hypothetical protein